MRWDLRTRAYVDKRTKQGLSKKDIIRCLKRHIIRELYPDLLLTPGRLTSIGACSQGSRGCTTARGLTPPETTRLKKTVDAWWPEIETFIQTRVTNVKTEAANVTIKNIKRTGRGYRSPENYRCRIMLYSAARTAA